jgi:hypothetical protein
MNGILMNENRLQKWVVLLLLTAVPVFAWGQKKTSAPAPKAPAQHSSAPAHSSAPSHAATQSHTSGPSHTATAGHSTSQNHAATTGHTTTPSHAATTGHSTTQSHAATTGHTTTPSHAATTGHSTTPSHAATTGHTATPNHAATPNRAAAASHTPPGRSVSLKGGGHASLRPNGSVRSIDRNGMHIEHGLHGGSRVVGEHNGARVVNTGRHGGYVQRAYVTRGGHAYYSRTFYANGHYSVGVYRGYGWGGHMYYGYYPGVWYNPGFYGWGFHPWGAPVYWGIGAWGWGGSPWFGFYGGFWNPYPYYGAPYYWLTDYLISQQLQAAYAARAEANADAVAADAQAGAGDGGGGGGGGDAAPAAASNAVVLTPEVKEAIAQEVKAQLAAQQAQATQNNAPSGGAAPAPTNASDQTPPPALDPAQRTFVVDTDVTVVANGQECALTAGDVITRLTDTPDADQLVNASVSASKKADCASGQTVAVKVDDLQEMYNHFQENITNGMGEMAKKQGTGGMPKAPDTSTQASGVPAPPPDTTAAKTLQDQQAAADQTDQQVKQETAGGGQ